MSNLEFNRKSQHLQQLFGDIARQVSYETGFVQRQSKMSGAVFAKMFVLGCLDNPEASLNDLVQYSQALGVRMSEAGVQQRIDQGGAAFMKRLLEWGVCLCRQRGALPETVLRHFSQVNILDSSEIRLPQRLQADFRGKQGAALKVQLSFDYLSGSLNALEWTAGCQPDQNCLLHLQQAEVGSLHLFDLGYFDQQVFAQLSNRSAYFVSRLQTQTALYWQEADPQAIDLLGWLQERDPFQVEKQVYLGSKTRLPVRLLVQKLPREVVEERRRKARAHAKRWGKNCSQQQLAWLAWSVFITNVTPEWLSFEQVLRVYRVRWQVELLFKVCKSQAHLDKLRHWNAARLQCQLYARLLGVVLFQWLISSCRFTPCGELSAPKAFRILQRYAHLLFTFLSAAQDGLARLLQRMAEDFLRFAQKNVRKKSPSTYQMLLSTFP